MQTLSEKQLVDLVNKAIKQFEGDSDTLARAIGYLMVGQQFGWRAMFLLHRQSTIRNYEKILLIKDSRDCMPEEGPYAKKCVAYVAVKTVTNFWKAVKGEIPGIRSSQILKR